MPPGKTGGSHSTWVCLCGVCVCESLFEGGLFCNVGSNISLFVFFNRDPLRIVFFVPSGSLLKQTRK